MWSHDKDHRENKHVTVFNSLNQPKIIAKIYKEKIAFIFSLFSLAAILGQVFTFYQPILTNETVQNQNCDCIHKMTITYHNPNHSARFAMLSSLTLICTIFNFRLWRSTEHVLPSSKYAYNYYMKQPAKNQEPVNYRFLELRE